jgi:hypothetical protein
MFNLPRPPPTPILSPHDERARSPLPTPTAAQLKVMPREDASGANEASLTTSLAYMNSSGVPASYSTAL